MSPEFNVGDLVRHVDAYQLDCDSFDILGFNFIDVFLRSSNFDYDQCFNTAPINGVFFVLTVKLLNNNVKYLLISNGVLFGWTHCDFMTTSLDDQACKKPIKWLKSR
jgi:hypothetical protein